MCFPLSDAVLVGTDDPSCMISVFLTLGTFSHQVRSTTVYII